VKIARQELPGKPKDEGQSRQGRLKMRSYQPSLPCSDSVVLVFYPAVPAGLFSTAPSGAFVAHILCALVVPVKCLRRFCTRLFMRWLQEKSSPFRTGCQQNLSVQSISSNFQLFLLHIPL
jgi:hypothetical protein